MSKDISNFSRLLLAPLFFFFGLAFLAVPAISEETVEQLQQRINEYTQKLTELGNAKKTLSNEISYLNSQIELTLLQIQQTEKSISILETEIAELSVRIDKLDIDLNQLSSAFIVQVAQNYKMQKRLPIVFSLLYQNFNEFLTQHKYITTIQKTSRNTLINMETIRTNYDLQKQKKQEKQQQLETLQQKLASQKVVLAQSKQSKSDLLAVTQNDEARYQKLKKEAENELSALLSAKFVGKRQVKKGEALGLMGNTGYSFGDHLHFGLYELSENNLTSWSYANDIDSSSYLSQYQWPMNEPIRITQARGHTQYSYLYSDRFHHGIDMVSSNKTIMAVNEGVAYFFKNPSSSLGNHVKLFHPDGKMTLYLHMQ